MTHEWQKRIQGELDTRIPRGARSNCQNDLRQAFYFFRSQGHTFEASLENALGQVRKRDPNFVPKILPQVHNSRPAS